MPGAAYEKLRRELEILESAQTDVREWNRFASSVLELMMRCQTQLLETQRAIIIAARNIDSSVDLRELRAEAQGTMDIVDKLGDLYRRAQQHLAAAAARRRR